MNNVNIEFLADQVLEHWVHFDGKLHEGKKFPMEEYNALWLSVNRYASALGDSKMLNRNVAEKINGFREYLEVKSFRGCLES